MKTVNQIMSNLNTLHENADVIFVNVIAITGEGELFELTGMLDEHSENIAKILEAFAKSKGISHE